MAAIASIVDPILHRHGLYYRHRTGQTEAGRVTVTCVLSHRAGHSEETTLVGAEDNSGNKNGLQAIASTVQYLMRYTLRAALGLSITEEDDDGQAGGASAVITQEQLNDLLALIHETESDIERFCRAFHVPAVAHLPTAQYPKAVAQLKAKRDARRREAGRPRDGAGLARMVSGSPRPCDGFARGRRGRAHQNRVGRV